MAIILPRQFTSQPQYPAPLDLSSTLGQQVRFAVNGNAAFPVELCGNVQPTGTIGATNGEPPGTVYYPISGTPGTTWATRIPDLDHYLQPFTVNWYGYLRTNVQNILLDSLGSTYGWYFYLSANSASTIRIQFYDFQSASAGPVVANCTDNTLHSIAGTYDGVGTVEYFLDGISIGTAAWTTGLGLIGANQTFGMYDDSGGSAPQRMLTVQAYKGVLSKGDISSLSDNPWQIFKAPSLRLVTAATAAGSTGTLARTNANDTVAGSGTTTVTGSLARTNANDASSASGTTVITGALARTNANDTSNASGAVGFVVAGSVAYTNTNDSITASGTTTVKGALARTNANDSVAAFGSGIVSGTLAKTNANDTSTASGTTAVTGTVARTNANDSIVASGVVTAPNVTGTLAATNRNDTSASAGTTTIKGSLARTNNNDSIAAFAVVNNGILFEAALMTGAPEDDSIKKPGIPSDAEDWVRTTLEIFEGRRGNAIDIPVAQDLTFSASPTKAECVALFAYVNLVRDALDKLITRFDS